MLTKQKHNTPSNCAAYQQALAKTIIDFWVSVGIQNAFIGPGSRSTPLVLAAAHHPKLKTTVVVDERSLAFCALGLAKVSQKPTMIITTSGSAVLNTLPAVGEAFNSLLPLLILSADRAKHLHDVGANQTFNQQDCMTSLVRFASHIESHHLNKKDLEHTLNRAFHFLFGQKPGPVHLNVAFDEPLYEPRFSQSKSLFNLKTIASKKSQQKTLTQQQKNSFLNYTIKAKRPLIIVGHTHQHVDDACLLVCQVPMVADIQAPMWKKGMLGHVSDWVAHLEEPDCVIQIGSRLISKALERLKLSGVTWIHLSFVEDPSNIGHTNVLDFQLKPEDLNRLFKRGFPNLDKTWLKVCQKKEQEAFHVQKKYRLQNPQSEESYVYHILEAIPKNRTLFVANSLLARQVNDLYTVDLAKGPVFLNRGLSGIDGTTATAAGIAFQNPCVLLTGDLAFLYDLHALKVISDEQLPLVIVVMNNGGGNIFETLPISQNNPYFETHFKAAHHLSFEHIAKQFNIQYHSCQDVQHVGPILEALCLKQKPAILELVFAKRA